MHQGLPLCWWTGGHRRTSSLSSTSHHKVKWCSHKGGLRSVQAAIVGSDDLRQCVSCEVGFYKLDVGNARTCTPCPEGLTTYMQGSISNASCIERSEPVDDDVTIAPTEEGVSNESTVPAVVLRIELADVLAEVQRNESLSELQALLLDAISGILGGGEEALSLEFLPIERRLATGNTGNMRLAVTIKYRSMDEPS